MSKVVWTSQLLGLGTSDSVSICKPTYVPSYSCTSTYYTRTEVCTKSPGRQDSRLGFNAPPINLGPSSENRVRACPEHLPPYLGTLAMRVGGVR